MRVTISPPGNRHAALKIEGQIAGNQVPELGRAWQELLSSLGQRKLSVDLRGVTHIDRAGRALLSEIYSTTGAEFLADTPLTKYFVEIVQQGNQTNRGETRSYLINEGLGVGALAPTSKPKKHGL